MIYDNYILEGYYSLKYEDGETEIFELTDEHRKLELFPILFNALNNEKIEYNGESFIVDTTNVILRGARKEKNLKLKSSAINNNKTFISTLLRMPLSESYLINKNNNSLVINKLSRTFQLNDKLRKSIFDNFVEKAKTNYLFNFCRYEGYDNLKKIYLDKCFRARKKLSDNNVNFNDYANLDIINDTSDVVKEYVRMHLRPKTPDYYSSKLKVVNYYNDINTCYIVFNNSLVLDLENIFISNIGLAYMDSKVFSLDNEKDVTSIINNFNYDKIYYMNYTEDMDIKKHKMAEVLVKDKISIDYIQEIVFPNQKMLMNFKKEFLNWNVQVRVDVSYF